MNKKKKTYIVVIVCLIVISISFAVRFGCKAYWDYEIQKNLDDHFGDISLSDDEIDALAKNIVSPEPSAENNPPSQNSSLSSDELEILQNAEFQETLAEAMAEIHPLDIIDISVSVIGTSNYEREIIAYVTTDLRTLSVFMSELSVSGTWIYYIISDSDSGHVYYCDESSKKYTDIYDYYTDELISPKAE